MESKFHRWWLGSCVAALLLASWAGGFSVAVTAVFIVIYLTGVTLIGPDDEAPEPVEVVVGAPVDVVAPAPEPEAPAAEAPAAEATAVEAPETEPTVEAEPDAPAEAAVEPPAAAESTAESGTDHDEDDDAVPYPEDVDDEPAVDVQEPSPA